MSEETQEIKIILLGDTGVGKTNLIYAFLNSGFQDYPGSTLASYSFEGDYFYKNNTYTLIYIIIIKLDIIYGTQWDKNNIDQ